MRSACWPQDLYRVGDYDSDEGDLWHDSSFDEDGDDSDGGNESWETEEEVEQVGDANIEDIHNSEDEIKNKVRTVPCSQCPVVPSYDVPVTHFIAAR